MMLTKLLLSPDEASAALGVKRAKLFQMLAAGEIASFKVGRLRRIPMSALQNWVTRQIDQQGARQADTHYGRSTE